MIQLGVGEPGSKRGNLVIFEHAEAPTISDAIDILGAKVVRNLVSDAEMQLTAPAKVFPGIATCVSFWEPRYVPPLQDVTGLKTLSSLVLIPSGTADLWHDTGNILEVDSPRTDFALLCNRIFKRNCDDGISSLAVISLEANLGIDVRIGPGAVIGAATIGSRTSIGANTFIADGVMIGEDCIIGPNSTIGHEGFGYVRDELGNPFPFPHVGSVRIGNRVDIGANACVDRGALEDTLIDDDVKIDNLVHIAHNVHIKQSAFVIATAIVCGSATIGERAWVAPNASILEKVTIGDDATIGLSSTVLKDVPARTKVVGSPARVLKS